MKKRYIAAFSVLLVLSGSALWADTEDASDEFSGQIISKYLTATQTSAQFSGASMEVDIDASVPNLKEHGRLRALRDISKVGLITYRVLGFQGDNTIKNQVIARYLQAEQQGQGDQSLSITPANYRFKFKGQKVFQAGSSVYVFQLSPRKKRVGLFKGELWLDAATCLPVLEKGRLVKNPTIFFRRVDFEREFAISNGAVLPAHMSSTIDTRLVGKVELSVSYSNVEPSRAVDESDSSNMADRLPTVPR